MARPGIGSLLLLGAAAFGVYKYSKMSEQQKADLKNKGKKLVDENLGKVKDVFGQKKNQPANAFDQNGSAY
ncbi:MAG: hypothetical protein ACXWV0_02450 [Flavisolibacter sp.]